MADKPTLRLVQTTEHGYVYQCEGEGAKQRGKAHPTHEAAAQQAYTDWCWRTGKMRDATK